MDPWSFSLRKTACLVATLLCLTMACGNDDDPILAVEPANFIGTWSVTETASFPGDPAETLPAYDMVVTQGNAAIEIQIEGDMFTGTVVDRTLTISGGTLSIPFCSPDGDRFMEGTTLTMDANGNALAGVSEWCCPAGAIPCGLDGTSTLTATRQNN